MGWELDKADEPIYTPTKLSLLISPPTVPSEDPPPPLETTVSIPFKWEEVPGKPRHSRTELELGNSVTKTLELPPRLLFLEAIKGSNVDLTSPTTVLDGPYVGRAMSFTSSYRTPRVHWNSNFGSTRWSGFRKIHKEEAEGSFDFSELCTSTVPEVKITRVHRRAGGLLSLSTKARSHFWASIYESFKQVVPWRRKQEKHHRKCTSKFDIL